MFKRVFQEDPLLARDADILARLIVATIRGLALDIHSGAETKSQKATYFTLVEMILGRRSDK